MLKYTFIAKKYRIQLPAHFGWGCSNPFRYASTTEIRPKCVRAHSPPESPGPGHPDCWHRCSPSSGTSACLETKKHHWSSLDCQDESGGSFSNLRLWQTITDRILGSGKSAVMTELLLILTSINDLITYIRIIGDLPPIRLSKCLLSEFISMHDHPEMESGMKSNTFWHLWTNALPSGNNK